MVSADINLMKMYFRKSLSSPRLNPSSALFGTSSGIPNGNTAIRSATHGEPCSSFDDYRDLFMMFISSLYNCRKQRLISALLVALILTWIDYLDGPTRRLRRDWRSIFPVPVFGSSLRNSISRGYL